MKFLYNILYLYLVASLGGCSSGDIKISHDFDHGSIGDLKETEPGSYEGSTRHWLKRDSIGDQYYWFYFKADHIRDKEVSFVLQDLVGVYRRNPHLVYTDYTQPVYSYDQESWERIGNVAYDSASHTFRFSHLFQEEPVWIAYAHPYPLHRLISLVSSIRDNEFVTIETLAQTMENRGVELITITDPDIPDEAKKTIFLMAMQHAGEDAGTYLLEGMIQFLLSDDEKAKTMREKFIYKLIPLMNPDGVFNGTTRYNMEMEDLNNIWLNDEKMQPEVAGVKRWVDSWYAGGKEIDLFLDVHNHSQFYTYNVFIFNDHSLDTLVTFMNDYWPARIWHSEFEGSSCAYFYREGIPCGTIELTQSYVVENDYLTIEDYHGYGKGVALGIFDYFESLDEEQEITGRSS